MSHKLVSGCYRIVSSIEGARAIGIDHTLPTLKPVRIDMPIQEWVIQIDGDTILLGIHDYRYTGVINDSVVAVVSPEEQQKWVATYRGDGYTIALASDQTKGWTLPSGDDVPRGSPVEIGLLLETFPGIYFANQLYYFEPIFK